MSCKLIDAGLDSLKVSIQGLDDVKYKNMCSTSIKFKKIVENVKFFYENKKNTVVNVKIISDAFENKQDEVKFYNIFGDISDLMNVENLVAYQETSYDFLKTDNYISQTGTNTIKNRICQLPFYFYSVYPDGEIIPCCMLSFDKYKKLSLGNVRERDLCAIWNSNCYNLFRLMHLKEQKNLHSVCVECEEAFTSQCRKEDNIDMYKKELIDKYSRIKKRGGLIYKDNERWVA